MNIQLSNAAILEISFLSSRAETLARGTASERSQSTILCQRIGSIRQTGISSDEMRSKYAGALVEELSGPTPENKAAVEARYQKAFHRYLAGNEIEMRDFLAGTQTLTYSQPASGGYFVPQLFRREVMEALGQTSPLFNPNVVELIQEPTFAANPKTVSGWDLTIITSAQVGEGTQNVLATSPTVRGRNMSGYMFRTSLAMSVEFEEDILDASGKMARAIGIGFGRGGGYAITNGSGSGQPQGIYTAAPSSGITLGVSAGKISATEINSLYFSINRIYRASPKCAWLVPDSVYQALRNSTDNSGRPLLNMHHGDETLLGKNIYVTPDLPAVGGSPLANGALIFGDLSHFLVRISAPWIQRSVQSAGGTNGAGSILAGEATFHGRVRIDSYLFDPSNSVNPPIVSATIAHQ